MIKRICILMIAAFLMVIEANAQDIKKDFAVIYQNYLQVPSYDLVLTTKSYLSAEDNKPTIASGRMIKSGENHYMEFGGQTLIRNEKEGLSLSLENRWIYYYDEKELGQITSLDQYKSFLAQIENAQKVTYMGEANGIKKYAIDNEKGFIERTEVFLDMQSKFVSKIIFYYKKSKEDDLVKNGYYQVVIDYQVKSLEKPMNTWFDLSKYII